MKIKMNIKRNVWIRIIAALLSILIFSIAVNLNIANVQSAQANMAAANTLLEHAQGAKSAHYKWCSQLSNTIYTGVEFTGSLDDTTCDLGKWLYGNEGQEDAAIMEFRQELKPLHKTIHESASYVLELLNTDPEAAQDYYHETIQSNVHALIGILDEMIVHCEQLNTESRAETEDAISSLRLVSLVCFVLALICLFSLVYFIIRQVIRPVLHISERAACLKDGVLDFKLDYQSKNELGDLAGSLQNSIRLIHDYVDELNTILDQLAKGNFDVHTKARFIGDFQSIETSVDCLTTDVSKTIREIDQAAEQVYTKSEQIAATAQTIASGATEQASAVEELMATTEELLQTSRKNARMAGDARQWTHQAEEQLSASHEHVQEMVSAMEEINEGSKKIAQIISTIENIAFQTNILALNAAVEAARAGNAGKGFAVVADEVRTLAIRSDEAAKATKSLIENSIASAQKGHRVVDQVSTSLDETMELMEKLVSEINGITGAVDNEVNAITQVNDGISQISAVVQNNSATSEEAAAASEELFSQVRSLQAQTRKFQPKKL